ncbi:nucleotide-binding protein [Limnofasciculus baicalensis]|uniref:AAA family ATPase n=1 Tax=Limnofasciculus baicalensis BBK-W-15 TaxID=2699891 RepID=A0AAE3GQT8_9CYAN|nr:AAA family ATPase [Limnofasciculus baicalensis]MCP2728168.1 AAA family ATPase [Limnofasciculus baicalensis BBK-W-15]
MSSSTKPPYLRDFAQCKQHVASIFHNDGWEVETPDSDQPDYDLVVRKGNQVGAIHVKWLISPVQKPQILRFLGFLESEAGKQFNCGFFVTTKGFSAPARALITSWGMDAKIHCGITADDQIIWVHDEELPPPNPPKQGKIYIGVFTCKGGVGKTTVSAHLAGSFALEGFNVALVDLDPEQNLQKLLGDGVDVPKSKGLGASTYVAVYDWREWHEDAARDCKIVICDCSPALERNPKDLISKFDYCLIPTTLNPLGINKHGQVIKDTVREIRAINKQAHLFVLVNNFKNPGSQRRLKLLRDCFINTYEEIKQTDDKFHCIDPTEVCIRSSDQLYYWGIHLLEHPEEARSELAFKLVGGICYPREDFISLADYIEREAGWGILRN